MVMSLPLGKLTILLGAGIVGSVLAKEGRLSNVSDLVSGALKLFSHPVKQGDSVSSGSKPRNDILLDQVNNLRKELQSLTINSPITIVTGSAAGARKYGIILIVVVVGYGYVWWKGWKLPDLRFATKRSLSDACNSVAKQLEDVYSSISAAQRQLSSKVTSVDRDVNKIVEISQATKEEVTVLRGRSKMIGEEFQSVRDVVQILEIKLSEIEGKQDITTQGVKKLCDYAWRLDNGGTTEQIQDLRYGFSGIALEPPEISPSSSYGLAMPQTVFERLLCALLRNLKTGSLPALPFEPPSPSDSNGSQKKAVSAPGLKDLNGVSEAGESSNGSKVSNGIRATEELGNRSSSNGVLGRRFSTSILTRQRSATNAFAQAALSSGQQC